MGNHQMHRSISLTQAHYGLDDKYMAQDRVIGERKEADITLVQ